MLALATIATTIKTGWEGMGWLNRVGKNLHNRSINTRQILRRILGPKNQRTNNATQSTHRHKNSTTERTCPMTGDIIRLPGHHGRDVRVAARGNEEDTEVLHARDGGET